jgi:hypothetical protein
MAKEQMNNFKALALAAIATFTVVAAPAAKAAIFDMRTDLLEIATETYDMAPVDYADDELVNQYPTIDYNLANLSPHNEKSCAAGEMYVTQKSEAIKKPRSWCLLKNLNSLASDHHEVIFCKRWISFQFGKQSSSFP